MERKLDKCTIRPWRRGDEMSLVRHAGNRKVWINLRDRFPHPYTMADAREWIDRCAADGNSTQWAIAVDGHPAGGIGLDRREDVNRIAAEIGFWLGEELWGRGIMTEAVGAVTRYGFQTLGLERIYAEVFAWNPPSMRVLEKNGYTREGILRSSAIKDGRIIDQFVWAITSSD
jgi:RimJ/RimL family protein N-acetyltransferase